MASEDDTIIFIKGDKEHHADGVDIWDRVRDRTINALASTQDTAKLRLDFSTPKLQLRDWQGKGCVDISRPIPSNEKSWVSRTKNKNAKRDGVYGTAGTHTNMAMSMGRLANMDNGANETTSTCIYSGWYYVRGAAVIQRYRKRIKWDGVPRARI